MSEIELEDRTLRMLPHRGEPLYRLAAVSETRVDVHI